MFLFRKNKKINFIYISFIFFIMTAWIFSGWPNIFNFPPEIQEAWADTDTYYGTHDSANSDMTNSVNAETDNTQYAYGNKNKKVVIQSWSGTAGSGTISGVRIYCQHYATTPDGNDYTLVDYSLDNWVTTGATTGQQVMPSGESSFSVDITADRSWTWTNIGNLEVRAAAKASGKQNFTDDYIDVLYIQVDYTPPSGTLTVDIVDSGGSPVPSPTMAMTEATFSFDYQTGTGTFGVTAQKIRVQNTTANAQWTLTITADLGATAFWDGAASDYDFNDPTANAGDGGDTDSLGGQMTINASVATLGGTCSATDITKESSASFSEGAANSITLLTAGASADTDCYWDLTGVSISQTIPAGQSIDSYSINMLLTVAAP